MVHDTLMYISKTGAKGKKYYLTSLHPPVTHSQLDVSALRLQICTCHITLAKNKQLRKYKFKIVVTYSKLGIKIYIMN